MAETTPENAHTSTASDGKPKSSLKFFKGGVNVLSDYSDDHNKLVQRELTKALSAKNLSFLLGAGCSSYIIDGEEKGVPTMKPLAEEFIKNKSGELEGDDPFKRIVEYGVRLEHFNHNLEDLLQILFSLLSFVQIGRRKKGKFVQDAIEQITDYLYNKINLSKGDEVLNLYQSFYKRIFFRERSLPRPWVFTTNYDLLNEHALDTLGIAYCNGFSGGLTRRFNPSTFKLTLAQELDVSANRWVAVDNFVYLCKLHGSISWVRDDKQGLWPFKEVMPDTQPSQQMMIYPTPAKEGQSLGSPYSDLFREFQGRVVREQSVLLVMGYSFSDEHINNIIYQALTIPSFRLIIFADPDSEGDIAKLKALDDPRIWIIGGQNQEHFFKKIVENLLPEPPAEETEDAIKKLQNALGVRGDS